VKDKIVLRVKVSNITTARALLLIVLIFTLYLVLIYPYVHMPPVGRHAWNEAIYLTFLHSIMSNNNPFLYYQAYDKNRPDFNVGYLYFWVNYIFCE